MSRYIIVIDLVAVGADVNGFSKGDPLFYLPKILVEFAAFFFWHLVHE